jgi:hypothetical protein
MYIHQRYENNVILFMVVLITLSGVGLAGVQLMTSYKLAEGGHAMATAAKQTAVTAAAAAPAVTPPAATPAQSGDISEVWLEQGKLTIRSSVTGLVVLALSLAFFFIYVAMVYTIKIPADPAPADTPSASSAPTAPATPAAPAAPLPRGGNGPPM